MNDDTNTLLREILKRLTRLETRLMKLMLFSGMRDDGENKIVYKPKSESCTIIDKGITK